jgi:hypothetical protein
MIEVAAVDEYHHPFCHISPPFLNNIMINIISRFMVRMRLSSGAQRCLRLNADAIIGRIIL